MFENMKQYINELNELRHYYLNIHGMNQIRGRVDFYLITMEIRSYYSSREKYNQLDIAGQKIVDYIFSDEFYRRVLDGNRIYALDSYQNEFVAKHYLNHYDYPSINPADYPAIYSQDGTPYVLLEGRKVFLPLNQENALNYWLNLMSEQLPNHPHCYLSAENCFTIEYGDIVADDGGAEGFFCIPHLDKIKHAYIFEASDEWFKVLEKTYEPYKDKVTLVKDFVGDGHGNISLDEYFKDREKPTFIKMDVEGAEGAVLRGMNTLLKDPNLPMRLAVCTYHRQEDAPYIESLLGELFETNYSDSYYWHMPDPMPPFLRHGVLRAKKKQIDELTNPSTESIFVVDSAKETRLGCEQLGNEIVIGDPLLICCPKGAKESAYFHINYDTVQEGLEECKRRSDKLLDLHKKGIAGPCEGCGCLRRDDFNKTSDFISFLTSNGFKDTLCNVKCIYCNVDKELQKNGRELMDFLKQIFDIYTDKKIFLTFASGEFFARKDAEAILAFLYDKDIYLRFTINGTIYSETLMSLLRLGKVDCINVSLDSGTRETYKKVKGVDFFDKVVDNLEKYSQYNANMVLKYIILPDINDNDVDFDGFVDIATRINAQWVPIVTNINNRAFRLPEYTMNKAFQLYEKLKERNLPVTFGLEYFNEEDMRLIQSKRFITDL